MEANRFTLEADRNISKFRMVKFWQLFNLVFNYKIGV